MSRIRTFTDAGALIAAGRGNEQVTLQALAILDDPDREFISSIFLEMEVVPKALYHQRSAEVEAYSAHFARVVQRVEFTTELVVEAYSLAVRYGLASLDALHIAAALSAGAEEFVTTEKPGKPLYRVPGLTIVSLR
jgi:predicted nucleic acid-binding protein